MVGRDDALFVCQTPIREADRALAARPSHPEGEAELERQPEIHVEEVGPEPEGAEMAVEMRDVEAPEDRPFDLGAALLAHLVEIGVVPGVGHRPREATVAVEEARRVRDGTPPVRLPLRVESEVHADILAPVHLSLIHISEPTRRTPISYAVF